MPEKEELWEYTPEFNELSLEAFDRTGTAVILTNSKGEVHHLNKLGKHILDKKIISIKSGAIDITRLMNERDTRKYSGNREPSKSIQPHHNDHEVIHTSLDTDIKIIRPFLRVLHDDDPSGYFAIVMDCKNLNHENVWKNISEKYHLTRRETNVVRALVESDRNHVEVAKMLGISINTLKSNRLRAYQKLGVDNQASLVRLVQRETQR
jgi:DNA-binding CsgD family transcriptional regulator